MTRSPEPPNAEPDSAQVLEALDRILKTDKFQTAPQMSAFLSYVVEQAVSGNKKRIKAYTVAVDALGKPATFDPQNDPVVRVLAGRLRASLNAYYDAQPDTDVYIQMKPGSYIPIFRDYSAATTIAPEPSLKEDSKLAIANSDEAIQPLPESAFEVHDKTASNTALISAAQPFDSLPDPDVVSTKAAGDSKQNTDLAAFFASFFRFPSVGILLVLLSVGAAVWVKRTSPEQTTQLLVPAIAQTANPVTDTTNRQRPDKVSVFVDASSGRDLLSDDLNAILSGVLLESSEIRVYRMLDGVQTKRYWPEDYLLALEVLPLQSETRVSVQFVDAQTGRISHSDNLILSNSASESLTHEELKKIRNFAHQLISENGPLLLDYQRKLQLADSLQD